MTRLTVIDGAKHHERDTRPVPESVADRDGEPCSLLTVSATGYPLAAECIGCGERITLTRSMLADWQHADGSPPPRHPPIPPPRAVR